MLEDLCKPGYEDQVSSPAAIDVQAEPHPAQARLLTCEMLEPVSPQASDEEDYAGKTEGAMKFERLEIRASVGTFFVITVMAPGGTCDWRVAFPTLLCVPREPSPVSWVLMKCLLRFAVPLWLRCWLFSLLYPGLCLLEVQLRGAPTRDTYISSLLEPSFKLCFLCRVGRFQDFLNS